MSKLKRAKLQQPRKEDTLKINSSNSLIPVISDPAMSWWSSLGRWKKGRKEERKEGRREGGRERHRRITLIRGWFTTKQRNTNQFNSKNILKLSAKTHWFTGSHWIIHSDWTLHAWCFIFRKKAPPKAADGLTVFFLLLRTAPWTQGWVFNGLAWSPWTCAPTSPSQQTHHDYHHHDYFWAVALKFSPGRVEFLTKRPRDWESWKQINRNI